jgi:site-specific recombinase XerD
MKMCQRIENIRRADGQLQACTILSVHEWIHKNGLSIELATFTNPLKKRCLLSPAYFTIAPALRHTLTVGMLRSGAPLPDVADHLEHTDIKITRIYAKE